MSSQNNNISKVAKNNLLEHAQFTISGMSCQSCASRIEKLLNSKDAIDEANVNFAGEIVNVAFYPEQVGIEQILLWIKKSGFEATLFQLEQNSSTLNADGHNALIVPENWRLIVLAVTFVLFLIGMLGMLFGFGTEWMLPVWIQFVLSTLTQFVLASPFYPRAWSSIKGRMANMDVLVLLGTLTTWGYSSFIWLQSLFSDSGTAISHVYFETGVMIITFISFGKYLERQTKIKNLNSIEMMLSLIPNLVEKQSEIGEFYEIDLIDVEINDVLRAKQGSRIATDGVVISGSSWCDESHLTGESQFLLKEEGDKVLAGALIENGSLTYQVHAKGKDSQLGDMIAVMNEAQSTKAPIARLADKVASIFVPIVLVIAIFTFAITYYYLNSIEIAILHAVSVLVVACPCALGLATPSAIMVGMGLSSKYGVLFKNAEFLEKAGEINTVVFDKTGTLTYGKPSLVAHLLMDKSLKYNEVLQIAASIEVHASHPFATALVESAKKDKISLLPAKNIDISIGQGVQGYVENIGVVKVGSPSWLNFSLPADIAKKIPKVLQVSSLVAVSIDDIPLGLFAFADDIRPDANRTIELLQNADIDVILMSGDRFEVVEYISEKLNISEAYAEMTPRQKAEKIESLQEEGYKIAMLGDGVNDSPAMIVSDASFAMHHGTDIAKNTASACLMGNSIIQLVDAIKISKMTVNNIKQNLFLAFFYNFITIPLAALGYLNPIIAGAMMALSSISVLLNALRLNSYAKKS